ncbi:MAG: hypothetical protein VCC20_05920 [Myxococcota bacterium]
MRVIGHPLFENHGLRQLEGIEDLLVDLGVPDVHHADEADLAVSLAVVVLDEINAVAIDLDEAARR